jgi:excisionase family DNA binding protein
MPKGVALEPEDTKKRQARAKTRKKPNATATTNGSPASDPEVFTFGEAAGYLRVTEAEPIRLIHDQALPGRQFGTEWRFLKSAIQDWLKTPPVRGSREAVLSTIGSWKDDPHVEAELAEIYRKRGEDLVGDIQ